MRARVPPSWRTPPVARCCALSYYSLPIASPRLRLPLSRPLSLPPSLPTLPPHTHTRPQDCGSLLVATSPAEAAALSERQMHLNEVSTRG